MEKDNTTAVEVKDNLEEENVQEVVYSNILDRANMTKTDFRLLWTGLLTHAFLFSFEICLIQGINGYVIAYFTKASLNSIMPTILAVLATALVPFYTKVSDVFGRAQSMTYAIVSYFIGLVIEGLAQSFEHLAIGQIFYGMGITGIQTLSQVLIADTTLLIDRGLMFAIWDLGSAINIWVAQVLIDPLTLVKSDPSLKTDKWRIGYILMGITAFLGAIVLLVPLWRVQLKSKSRGLKIQQRKTIRWLLHEFDVVGALLITLGLSMTLIPLIMAYDYRLVLRWHRCHNPVGNLGDQVHR
ncbi:hypothetical protein BGX27_002649 [Mortierella sp. AM989]|nr:hypothetical protein BGX27_002649 [Mortierella sp. AM989]